MPCTVFRATVALPGELDKTSLTLDTEESLSDKKRRRVVAGKAFEEKGTWEVL